MAGPMFARVSILSGLMAGVAACASAPPIPAPVLSYANAGCSTTPDLSAPLSMTPDKERAVHLVVAEVDETAACIMRNGAAVPYVLLALPQDYEDKTLIVGSQLDQNRIFAPEVVVLDAQGNQTRTFNRDEYFYRGSIYSVQFRPRQDERYVLVAAAPDMVGKAYDAIQIGISTTAVYTPYGGATFNSGTEAATSRTFAYNGTVKVLVNDADTKEEN